jgi:APA family basic amino acid/polyamine antiporter
MKTGLKREIGLFSLILYGVGIILGAGVYALIGKAAGMAGNSVWASFIVAAIVGSFTGLSYAELTSVFPKEAAEYVYVKNAFKNNMMAFLIGWIEICADMIAASAVALGFAGYFSAIFGTPIVLTAIGLLAVLSLVNFWGIKQSTKINVICSLVEVGGLILVILLGARYFGSVNYFDTPYGFTGILGASALIFFAFIGFEDIANVSEEVKNPRKNLPKSILASIAITTILYVLVSIAVVSVVDWHELATSTAPLATVASNVFGPNAFFIMSFIALFATGNTVLVLLIVGSREIYGIARDGILPKILSRLNKKRGTPYVSILFVAAVTILFVFLSDIKIVASITDFGTFLVYIFVNASVIILRYTKPNIKRPFKLPLSIGKFPIISFLGLTTSVLLMLNLEPFTVLLGLALLATGIPIFWYLKGNIQKSLIK